MDTLETAIDRLENFYKFECEAGPLANCQDWLKLKGAVMALRLNPRIQELEEARNKHWRGEEIAVRQLEIVKAQLADAKQNADDGDTVIDSYNRIFSDMAECSDCQNLERLKTENATLKAQAEALAKAAELVLSDNPIEDYMIKPLKAALINFRTANPDKG